MAVCALTREAFLFIIMMLAAISELPFLDLGDDSRVSGDGKFFGDDDNIRPLNEAELPSFPVPFGNGTETSIYVSHNAEHFLVLFIIILMLYRFQAMD